MKSHRGHTELEQRSAEECRAVADAHAQTLKDFWKRFAVSGLFVIAVVIVIFASLAWFASNSGVSGTTSTISAKAARFGIEGYSGSETADVGYYERSSTSGTEKPTNLQSNDSMKVSATFNLNNYDGGSLRPGSSGELQITVTPVAKNLGDVKISLERIVEMRSDAKAAAEAANNSGNDTSTTSSTSIYAGKTIPTENELEALFRGHIVFFRSFTGGYYSDPVLDDSLTIQASQFAGDGSTETTNPVTVTLYWVWPSQFSSFVLTGQINYNPNLFASATAAGYSDLLAAINNSKSAAVESGSNTANATTESNTSETAADTATGSAQYYRAEDWSTTKVSELPNVVSDMTAANLQTCAAYYNYADEALGSCAAFLQVRFTAEEASQTS